MASLALLPSIAFQSRLLRLARPAAMSPVALLLVVLALGGAGLALLGPSSAAPATTPLAPLTPSQGGLPRGDIPIIGDPIRDLTIWWSNRLSDASRAGLDSLRGRYLTPIDPMADEVIKTLYGKILVITIPLLTLGGMILGYLIMTARTTGETAYSARAVTPRFVTGATLSVLGIFLVSVFAQFVTATDMAMIGVSIPGDAVGDPTGWPASGGVFEVLQKVSFDPRIPEGPNNWNDGAWLSAGMSAAILVTLLQMVNAALSAVERLMVLVSRKTLWDWSRTKDGGRLGRKLRRSHGCCFDCRTSTESGRGRSVGTTPTIWWLTSSRVGWRATTIGTSRSCSRSIRATATLFPAPFEQPVC
jgi:hypothetical protein